MIDSEDRLKSGQSNEDKNNRKSGVVAGRSLVEAGFWRLFWKNCFVQKKAFWLSSAGLWIAGITAAGIFVAADIAYNRLPIPPIDDTYIHFQYAKQLARGFFFRYFDGDPVSTGATSFIYPILLAPFWKLGMRGNTIIWAAHILNFLSLAASMTFVYATLRRVLHEDKVLAWMGGLLTGMSGWYLWGVTSGMEIAVNSCAIAWLIYALTLYIQENRKYPLGVGIALLSMARPEGLVMSYAVVFFLWLHDVLYVQGCRKEQDTTEKAESDDSEKNLSHETAGGFKKWIAAGWRGMQSLGLPLWIGLAIGTLPTIIMMAASGHTTTNGMIVKSHFAIDMDWVRYIWETGRTIAAVPGRLLWSPNSVVHGLMIIGVVLGIASLLCGKLRDKDGNPNKAMGMAVIGAFLSIIAFYGFLMEHVTHHNRYYMPYQPLVVMTLIIGIHALGSALKERLGTAFRRSATVVLLLIGIGSVGEWARIYAHNCSDIADTYLPMSAWVRENVPKDVSIAVHDAGAIPYLGERKCHDIIGLVSNEFRVPGGGRSDAVAWEVMNRLRPGYMIIYPGFFPQLARLPVFRKVHSVRIPRVTIAGGPEKVAYKILWDQLAPGDQPHGRPGNDSTAWRIVNSVNPGDPVNEETHSYIVDHGRIRGAARFRLSVFRVNGRHLIDGARVYSGRESFKAGPLDPSRPMLLGVRTLLDGKTRLKVSIDGEMLEGYWELEHSYKGNNNEAYLEIPASALKSKRPRITIEPMDGRDFASYQYLVLQP